MTRNEASEGRASLRELGASFGLALALRSLVAAFAWSRFPPADDGNFYHVVAQRIARGLGYSWAWPDGVVTYAAHYPVGYPALLGGAYAVWGANPGAAMLVNALLGAALVASVHYLASRITSRAGAWAAALLVGLHPTLLLYTPALMTEAVATALLVVLAALGARASEVRRHGWRWGAVALLGAAFALLVLVRPQLLPLSPVLGAIAIGPSRPSSMRRALMRRGSAAGIALGATLLACVPWTLRNCQRMDGCVFVSANGGWNLLIGTMPEGHGSFAPIAGPAVPFECREVFGEVAKDRCFGRAGRNRILAEPLAWLRLVPAKLGQLYDHGAVAAQYLSASNGSLVGGRTKLLLGAIETVADRLLLLAAGLGLARAARSRASRRAAHVVAGLALLPWGAPAVLLLLALLGFGRALGVPVPLRGLALAVLGLTTLTHVVFFGAPRYALPVLPWLVLLAVLPRGAPGEFRPARLF